MAKTIKYLRINLTKHGKNLYSEIIRHSYKQIEEVTKVGKTSCLWIERINIVKVSLLLQVVFIFSAIFRFIKISMAF